MKIVIKQLAKCTIEDFADAHNLTMVVAEMKHPEAQIHSKYIAHFEDAEDQDHEYSSVIGTNYGEGRSPDEAIKRYANNISGRMLVIDAMSSENRKEIQCPIFIN